MIYSNDSEKSETRKQIEHAASHVLLHILKGIFRG